MCACTFSPDGGSELLAVVAQQGIFVTDGYSFDALVGHINWRAILSLTSTSTPIALVNDPELKELRFLFRNDSYTPETYLDLRLSYAPDHMSRGADGSLLLK